MRSTLLVAAGFAVACAFAFACGGEDDAVCGNGIPEEGEQCDDGNQINTDSCTNSCIIPQPQTNDVIVKWEFNKEAAPQFSADGCLDMGASRVVVELVGAGEPRMGEELCSLRQVTFIDLDTGVHTARISVLDADGNLLTNDVVESTFMVTGGRQEHEVVIGFDEWRNDYTGTFYFRLAWGGSDCNVAAPPVTQHRLRLEVGGDVVDLLTDVGDRVDGTMPGPCRSLDEQFPQSVLMVPWGPAVFTVSGLDSGGEVQFRETFDTFVGAGVNNPEMEFDVNSVTPDAGAPDAGAPDGGM